MRFHLTLSTTEYKPVIPINYQYPLSAVIYRIIESADADYSSFLHNKGYGKTGSLKKFKLFTFSDIQAPFCIQGDRLLLKADTLHITVCFHMPAAAEKFIQGLFMNQQIEIADRKSRAVFTVQQVEAETDWRNHASIQEGIAEVLLQPMSPMVVGRKNAKGNYDYLAPDDPDFIAMLLSNWKEKFTALHGSEKAESVFMHVNIQVVFYSNPPRSRLITIKADTPAETKIRGFTNFRLKVRGEQEPLELLFNAGVGIHNSLGMGSVDLFNKKEF